MTHAITAIDQRTTPEGATLHRWVCSCARTGTWTTAGLAESAGRKHAASPRVAGMNRYAAVARCDMVNGMARMLMGAADAAKPKNYVKVEVVGLIPPFDRAYVELVRPGGKTSHELRELLRSRLEFVRTALGEESIRLDAFRQGMIAGIDETLAEESP